jgi:hypothetical protein
MTLTRPARDRRPRRRGIRALAAAFMISACSTYRPTNVRLKHWDIGYGYRPKTTEGRRPIGEVLLAAAPSIATMLNAVSSTQVYIPELTFESITNDEERNFFNDVPTSFSLPGETVDRLIEEGRKLLRESPDFQRLKANLQGPGGPGSR